MDGISEYTLAEGDEKKAIFLRPGMQVAIEKQDGKTIIHVSRNGALEELLGPSRVTRMRSYGTITDDTPEGWTRVGYHDDKEMGCEVIDPRTIREIIEDFEYYPELRESVLKEMESAITELTDTNTGFLVNQKQNYDIIAFRYNGTIEAIMVDSSSGPKNHEEAVALAFDNQIKKDVPIYATLRKMVRGSETYEYFMHVVNEQ